MKKIILALALAFAVNVGLSQGVASATEMKGGAYGLTVDTVDNTEAIVKYSKVTQSHTAISMQAVITKISGTVGGTVIPVASNDGVNWVNISRASIAANTLRPAYKDTLTPANQTTNTKLWVFSNATAVDGQTPGYGPYLYYGIQYTGTGTMSAKFQGYIIGRK